MKQLIFIINPNSGTSSKSNLEASIARYLDSSKYAYTVKYTEYAGHARIIATESITANYDAIVACGGDGTINEVASALLNSETVLGIIPLGSGNGFAGHIGISTKIDRAISQINAFKTLLIDTCSLNDQAFVNVAGVGFDGLISYRIKNGKSRGIWMYLKTTFREMFKYKPSTISYTIDGIQKSGRFATIAVANGSIYGNDFKIAPGASVTDGKMEVVMIKKASLIYYLLNAFRFLNGTLYRSSKVEHITTTNISFRHDSEQYYHIDGEGFRADSDLHIRIHPNSLRVIIDPTKEKA